MNDFQPFVKIGLGVLLSAQLSSLKPPVGFWKIFDLGNMHGINMPSPCTASSADAALNRLAML